MCTSLAHQQTIVIPKRVLLANTRRSTRFLGTSENLKWVDELSRAARPGYLQCACFIVSLLVIVKYLISRQKSRISQPEGTSATALLWFEVPSQIFRAASAAFIFAAALQDGSNWPSVVTLTYAFVMGLVRYTSDLEWRHVALHHVNFMLASTLLALSVAHLLPYIDRSHHGELGNMMTYGISSLAAAVFLSFVTRREWVPPSVDIDSPESRMPSPEETCSWLEYYVTYEWLTPVILRGARTQVTVEDLPRLPWYDEPLLLLSRVQEARRKGKTTFWTLMYLLPKEISTMIIFIALCNVAELVAPYAIYQLLDYIQDPDAAPISPWLWVCLLFLGPLMRSVTFQQYIFTSTRLIVRVKAALTQELYYKAMGSMALDDDAFGETSTTSKSQPKPEDKTTVSSVGRLSNLMSADIDSLVNGRDIILSGVGLPIAWGLSLYGLYVMLDWAAFVGIAIMVALSPLPIYISGKMAGEQRGIKKMQDSRMFYVSLWRFFDSRSLALYLLGRPIHAGAPLI